MSSVTYIKEALSGALGHSTLIEINQKYLKDSIAFLCNSLLDNRDSTLVVVSAAQEAEALISSLEGKKKNVRIIDTLSAPTDNPAIFYTKNPSDLTKIQIGIEKFLNNEKGNNIVLFDCINALAIHTDTKSIARFFYLFNNKAKLNNITVILLTVHDALDKETTDTIKQFCDKIYNYSDIMLSSITPETV